MAPKMLYQPENVIPSHKDFRFSLKYTCITPLFEIFPDVIGDKLNIGRAHPDAQRMNNRKRRLFTKSRHIQWECQLLSKQGSDGQELKLNLWVTRENAYDQHSYPVIT